MPEIVGPAFRGVGYCSGCKNRKEIVAGGKCEACNRKSGFSVVPRPELQPGEAANMIASPNGRTRRDELLDWIVSHAEQKNIDKIYQNHMSELVANNRWVDLLEKETRERVLLRQAVELGWTEKIKEPEPVVSNETVDKLLETIKDVPRPVVPEGYYLREGKLVQKAKNHGSRNRRSKTTTD